jgi:hypothetical protein
MDVETMWNTVRCANDVVQCSIPRSMGDASRFRFNLWRLSPGVDLHTLMQATATEMRLSMTIVSRKMTAVTAVRA